MAKANNKVTMKHAVDSYLTPKLLTLKEEHFNLQTIVNIFKGMIQILTPEGGRNRDWSITPKLIQDDRGLRLFSITVNHESEYYVLSEGTHYISEGVFTLGLNKKTGQSMLLNHNGIEENITEREEVKSTSTSSGIYNFFDNLINGRDTSGDRREEIEEETTQPTKEYSSLVPVTDRGRIYLGTIGHMHDRLINNESMNDVAYIAKTEREDGKFRFTFHKADGATILGKNPGLTESMVQMVSEKGSLPSRESMHAIDLKGYIHVYSDSKDKLWFEDTREPNSGLMPFLRYQLGVGFRHGEVRDRLSLKQFNSEIIFKGAEWDATSDTIKWVYQGKYHGNGRTSGNGVWEFNTGKDGVDTMTAYRRKETSFEKTIGKGEDHGIGLDLSADGFSLSYGYGWSTWEEFTENIPDPNELEEYEYNVSEGAKKGVHIFSEFQSEGHYGLERLLNIDLERNPNGWVGGKAPGAEHHSGPIGREAKEVNSIHSNGGISLAEVNDSPWGRNELGHIESSKRSNDWRAEVKMRDSNDVHTVLDFTGTQINPRSNRYGAMVAATQTELTKMSSDKSIWREKNCDLLTGESTLIAFKNDRGTLDIAEFNSTPEGLKMDQFIFTDVDQSHDKFSRIETHFGIDLDPLLNSEANGFAPDLIDGGWDYSVRVIPNVLTKGSATPNREPWECAFPSSTSSTPLDNFDIDRTQTGGF